MPLPRRAAQAAAGTPGRLQQPAFPSPGPPVAAGWWGGFPLLSQDRGCGVRTCTPWSAGLVPPPGKKMTKSLGSALGGVLSKSQPLCSCCPGGSVGPSSVGPSASESAHSPPLPCLGRCADQSPQRCSCFFPCPCLCRALLTACSTQPRPRAALGVALDPARSGPVTPWRGPRSSTLDQPTCALVLLAPGGEFPFLGGHWPASGGTGTTSVFSKSVSPDPHLSKDTER